MPSQSLQSICSGAEFWMLAYTATLPKSVLHMFFDIFCRCLVATIPMGQAKDRMNSLVCQVSVTMLCINFFIATAFPQMLHVTGSVEAAKDLNSQFAAFLPAGGIVYIPLVGTLASQLRKAESRWNRTHASKP